MFVLLSVIDEAKLAKSPGSSLATIFICAVKNFPEDDKLRLEHLILSYQGRKEWQSPVEPQTLEAILLHSINFLDSKINFMRRNEL